MRYGRDRRRDGQRRHRALYCTNPLRGSSAVDLASSCDLSQSLSSTYSLLSAVDYCEGTERPIPVVRYRPTLVCSASQRLFCEFENLAAEGFEASKVHAKS